MKAEALAHSWVMLWTRESTLVTIIYFVIVAPSEISSVIIVGPARIGNDPDLSENSVAHDPVVVVPDEPSESKWRISIVVHLSA